MAILRWARTDTLRGQTGCVREVYPDDVHLSDEMLALFPLARVPLTVEEATAIYLEDGVPQSVRDAEAAEFSRYMGDVRAALVAAAAEIDAAEDKNAAQQAVIERDVTPRDDTTRVREDDYPLRRKRVDQQALGVRRAGLRDVTRAALTAATTDATEARR